MSPSTRFKFPLCSLFYGAKCSSFTCSPKLAIADDGPLGLVKTVSRCHPSSFTTSHRSSDFPLIRSRQCRWQVAVIILTLEWAFRRTHRAATRTPGVQWILRVWLDGVLACWVFRTLGLPGSCSWAVHGWIGCLCASEGCAKRAWASISEPVETCSSLLVLLT